MSRESTDIEQLKKAWMEMGTALGMHTPRVESPDKLNNMNTTLDKLRTRYRNIGISDVCGAIIFFPILRYADFLSVQFRSVVALSYAILLLILAGGIFWMWRGVGKIDPLTMTVSQVSEMALYYKKCHLRFVMAGFPLAACWIGYFAYCVSHSDFNAIGGIIVGGIVGGIIGFSALKKFMADYRDLSE